MSMTIKRFKNLFLLTGLCVMFISLCMVTQTAEAAKVKQSGDYKYRVSSGKVTILKYTGDDKNVKIPTKIAGKKVVSIGEAFCGNKIIRKITIPSSVEVITDGCFKNCSRLTKVTLPETVSEIPNECFSGCTKLSSINLGEIEEIGYESFSHCTSLKGEIDMLQLSNIDTAAFEYCTGISKVVFSDNLQLMGYLNNNTDIRLSYGSNYCYPRAGRANPFAYCTSLMEFVVPDTNANYSCVDGVIYAKTDNWLVAYPAGKGGSFVIAPTVEGISAYAFAGAKITGIQLTDKVRYYQAGAFEGSSIANLLIKKCNNSYYYSEDVFSNCNSLTSVTFDEKLDRSCFIKFMNCKALKSITLAAGTESLPDDFCNGCESLETVAPLNQLKEVSNRCFTGCKVLKNIDLKNVVMIGEEAFSGCSSFTGKVEMNNVQVINKRAFSDCTSINEVAITTPVSNVSLGLSYNTGCIYKDYQYNGSEQPVNPFPGCTSLMNISVPETSNYKVVNGVLYKKDLSQIICYPAGKTGKANIVYGVKSIDEASFEGSKASDVNLPNSLKVIYPDAFYNSKITSITIPKSTNTISDNVFGGCKELCDIKVKSGNKSYKTEDGVLYRKRGKSYILVCYPQAKEGKTFNLPKKTYVGDNRFDGCSYLKKVVIPEGIKWIGTSFSNCNNIKLYLPKSIKRMDKDKDGCFIFDKSCKKCTVYVYKNSKMHKLAVKNGIKYKIVK